MILSFVYLIVAYIMAITFHEFMHAYTSDRLGDGTARSQGRISLNPFAHVDPFMTLLLPALLIIAHSPVIFGAARPVPFNPWAVKGGKRGVALIAAAGPLTNLFVAAFFALWLRFAPVSANLVEFFVKIIQVNVGFFVFNLIPFPPLDGSRLLYVVAPIGVRDVMDRIERAGMMALLLFMFIGGPLLSPIIGQLVGSVLRFLIPGLTSLSG